MLTSEVLDKAADEIERRGWVGNGFHPDPWGGGAGSDAPVCIEGGIAAAMGLRVSTLPSLGVDSMDDLEACPAYQAMESYLGMENEGYLYHWNDRHGRTASEVIEVLRAAAMVERTREAAADRVSA